MSTLATSRPAGYPASRTIVDLRDVSPADWGVFGPDELPHLVAFFRAQGFAVLRGVVDDAALDVLDADLSRWQRQLLTGSLHPRHGTAILDDPDATVDGEPFAHYVCEVTLLSGPAREVAHLPEIREMAVEVLGPQAWLLEDDRFGVVFQDARPGRYSGYSRIGWHSDDQSGPTLSMWPAVSFTIHLDPTSPANGFLRVVPGSHHTDDTGMPPGFEKVPGEIAVYCDRGDVLFHDSGLWHAAARATVDGPGATRRHLRGSWYGGAHLPPGHGTADFVKNAAR
jgi:hypothetical protein